MAQAGKHLSTVVLTGGTLGSIGFHAARILVEQGHEVVLACRDASRAESAVQELNRNCVVGEPGARPQAHFVQMDLSSFASVRAGAQELLTRFPKVDALVCNAAIVPRKVEAAVDGYESSLTTNHLGHFLLTHLLMPALSKADSAKVVVVSSELHARGMGHLHPTPGYLFNILQGKPEPKPSMMQIYALTKLLNIWFAYHLAKQLPPSITCNAVTPGFVPSTNLSRSSGFLGQLFMKNIMAWAPFAVTVQEGARRVAMLVSGPELSGVTGKYFSRGRQAPSSELSYDAEMQAELWGLSCKACGIDQASAMSD